jgi:hypothetical protein
VTLIEHSRKRAVAAEIAATGEATAEEWAEFLRGRGEPRHDPTAKLGH